VAKEFKVFYAKSAGTTPENYSVDHTYGSYVFDRSGKIRLFVRHGKGPAPIIHDIKLLLN
jgi:protein SCO1